MMKKIINLLLVCIFLLMVPGCGILDSNINIIYTSDIHCNIDGAMDYASVKAYKDYLKKHNGNVVLVDGGDFTEGGLLGSKRNGLDVIEIMNEVGYDVVSLGNHEFDYGLEALKENIDEAKFDIVDCNLNYFGEGENPLSKVKPYVIKRYGTTKVAFIGIMTPEITLEREPSYKKLYIDGNFIVDAYADPNDGGDDGSALYEVIQNTIDEAKSKADIVVVISHIGVNHTAVINSYELIEYTHGIDVVLDAHAHKEINEYVQNNEGQDVLLFAVGESLNKIGKITINKDKAYETEYIEVFEKDEKIENRIFSIIN